MNTGLIPRLKNLLLMVIAPMDVQADAHPKETNWTFSPLITELSNVQTASGAEETEERSEKRHASSKTPHPHMNEEVYRTRRRPTATEDEDYRTRRRPTATEDEDYRTRRRPAPTDIEGYSYHTRRPAFSEEAQPDVTRRIDTPHAEDDDIKINRFKRITPVSSPTKGKTSQKRCPLKFCNQLLPESTVDACPFCGQPL